MFLILGNFGRMESQVQEHLAPASQPTPPLVRYPGGAGPQKPAPFFIRWNSTRSGFPWWMKSPTIVSSAPERE